jgi:hypothetical protein
MDVMRRNRAAEKKLDDDTRLLRIWRQWRREQLDEALAGPHGHIVKAVTDFLQHRMSLKSAPELLALLRRQDWRLVDADTRLTVLHEINIASARLRERNGLSPFSDSLPGEQPTLFELARVLLDPKSIASCPEQGIHRNATAFPN